VLKKEEGVTEHSSHNAGNCVTEHSSHNAGNFQRLDIHKHAHGVGCGHTAIYHYGLSEVAPHVDFIEDGKLHCPLSMKRAGLQCQNSFSDQTGQPRKRLCTATNLKLPAFSTGECGIHEDLLRCLDACDDCGELHVAHDGHQAVVVKGRLLHHNDAACQQRAECPQRTCIAGFPSGCLENLDASCWEDHGGLAVLSDKDIEMALADVAGVHLSELSKSTPELNLSPTPTDGGCHHLKNIDPCKENIKKVCPNAESGGLVSPRLRAHRRVHGADCGNSAQSSIHDTVSDHTTISVPCPINAANGRNHHGCSSSSQKGKSGASSVGVSQRPDIHKHAHGVGCGHTAVYHFGPSEVGPHVDFIQGGKLHCPEATTPKGLRSHNPFCSRTELTGKQLYTATNLRIPAHSHNKCGMHEDLRQCLDPCGDCGGLHVAHDGHQDVVVKGRLMHHNDAACKQKAEGKQGCAGGFPTGCLENLDASCWEDHGGLSVLSDADLQGALDEFASDTWLDLA